MPRGALTCVLCAAAFLVPTVQGQTYHAFQWKFSNNYVEQDFKECQTLPIIVQSLTNDSSALGVPPYYLVAFEASGVPTTSMIGNDAANLSWTANHKRGSTLMLSLMDSNGSTGGVPPNLYSMNPGNDTSCLPSPPSTELASIHPNVTDTIATCQPWGLTIEDGEKPYTIVFSAVGASVVTNVSMGDDDDVYTYINRADPGGELMASVVDATGQWGISSTIVHTAGSTDVDCTGLLSSSNTSAEIAQEALDRAHPASDADRRRRTRLIVGLTVGLGVPILTLAAWLCYRQKKLQDEQDMRDYQDATPRPLEPPSAGDVREVCTVPLSSKSSALTSCTPSGTPRIEVTPASSVYFNHEIAEAHQRTQSADTAASTSGPGPSPGPAAGIPSTSVAKASARYREAVQAVHSLHPTSSLSPPAQTSVQSLHGLLAAPRPGTATPPVLFDASLSPDIRPDIIVQHRDGGHGVVQELPPPYADLASETSSPPPISPLEAPPPPSSAVLNPPPPTRTA